MFELCLSRVENVQAVDHGALGAWVTWDMPWQLAVLSMSPVLLAWLVELGARLVVSPAHHRETSMAREKYDT